MVESLARSGAAANSLALPRVEWQAAPVDIRRMSAALLTARIIGLIFLPLTALVLPTLILRPLLPRDLSTVWPLVAVALAVAALGFVATKTYKLTGSRTGVALVTVASVGTTFVGVFMLLLWALSWA